MTIDHILGCIRKTNPKMTKDKLIKELLKTRYSTIALEITYRNSKKSAQEE